MLTVSQLSKSFAGRALFDDVSLQVNRGDRIELVGPNGAGKSTLFALLLGRLLLGISNGADTITQQREPSGPIAEYRLPQTVMLQPQDIARLIEEFFRLAAGNSRR